ncbi:MAG: hypothetical protein KA327_11980 [Pseudarcicella sp.]|nr:hypothetical protein [Pseudarcicella sp.]
MDAIKFAIKKLKIVYHFYVYKEESGKLWWTDNCLKVVLMTILSYFFTIVANTYIILIKSFGYIFSVRIFSSIYFKLITFPLSIIFVILFLLVVRIFNKHIGNPPKIDLSDPVRYKKYRNAAWLIRAIGLVSVFLIPMTLIKLFRFLETTFGFLR